MLVEEYKKTRRTGMSMAHKQKWALLSSKIKDKGLQELVLEGIGFHHA